MEEIQVKAIQDLYADDFAVCYGCGRHNSEGHHLKTYLEDDVTVSRFKPKPYHTAIKGFVYGGLLASVVDCHGTGSASIFYAKENGIALAPGNAPRFVTANLNVNYRKPTPLGKTLVIKGRLREITAKKVITDIEVLADEIVTVSASVTAVLLPENFNK